MSILRLSFWMILCVPGAVSPWWMINIAFSDLQVGPRLVGMWWVRLAFHEACLQARIGCMWTLASKALSKDPVRCE